MHLTKFNDNKNKNYATVPWIDHLQLKQTLRSISIPELHVLRGLSIFHFQWDFHLYLI